MTRRPAEEPPAHGSAPTPDHDDPAGESPPRAAVALGLNAAIVAMRNEQPQILTITRPDQPFAEHDPASWDMLPFGPFSPLEHRTLEIGLRRWVRAQTGLELGYVDQLYTFGDQGRHARPGDTGPHVVSIGYLALTRLRDMGALSDACWQPWYRYFPWEDWRGGKPAILSEHIEPRLKIWAERRASADEPPRTLGRAERLRACFGLEGGQFHDEKTLERYELLYEAGLMREALRDGRAAAQAWDTLPPLGRPMQHDHRRILATAMGRLRGQLKYRPVIFELMPESFTLLQLQRVVEAIAGAHLHKQNFRRLVEQTGLVEPTGSTSTASGGRPAQLYRFRRQATLERASPGLRVRTRRP